jgi:hypothetical protein
MQTTPTTKGTLVKIHTSTTATTSPALGIIESTGQSMDADLIMIKNQSNQCVTRHYCNFSETVNLKTFQSGSSNLAAIYNIGDTLTLVDAENPTITGSYEVQPGTKLNTAIGDYAHIEYTLKRWS